MYMSNVNTSQDQWSPALALSERLLLLHTGDGDLWQSERQTLDAEFSTPRLLPELNTSDTEKTPYLTADGLVVYFLSTRAGGFGSSDIWSAEREGLAAPFGTPQNVMEVNSAQAEVFPVLTADGLHLYVSSARGGSTGKDIYRFDRPTRTSVFTQSAVVAELNSEENDELSDISADGLEVFLHSVRPGGPGGWDIYRATRTSVDKPFSSPALVPELNTVRDDVHVRLSPDGTRAYYVRDSVTGGGSNSEIWVTSRNCLQR